MPHPAPRTARTEGTSAPRRATGRLGPRGRRRARIGGALLASVALTASVHAGATAEPEPDRELLRALAEAPADLETPFERSEGARWTTWRESDRFYRQLAAGSDRVRLSRVGRTTEGRPLKLVQIGDPAPAGPIDAADGSVLMYSCSVHGDEPSGREACMELARDLAVTADPAWTRLLRSTTVLLINANPDGWVADTRENAQDLDVNRDYMALETPEARAVVRTIRDWKPDVLNDLHEYGPREYYDTDLLQLWPRNRQIDGAIHDLSRTMSEDYAEAQVTSLGYTSGEYGLLVKDDEPFRQVAGDGQARILRNYAGLSHVVGMLSETANAPLDAEEEADPALTSRRRVEVNYTSAVGSAQFVLENTATLERETAEAAERVTTQGADRSGVVYFGGQDSMLPTEESEVEPEPMCGYRLTESQLSELRPTLGLHGIDWQRVGGGAFVSMAQEDQPLIPLLLDERYEYNLVAAQPVATC